MIQNSFKAVNTNGSSTRLKAKYRLDTLCHIRRIFAHVAQPRIVTKPAANGARRARLGARHRDDSCPDSGSRMDTSLCDDEIPSMMDATPTSWCQVGSEPSKFDSRRQA
jgi:hypothetical protein